MKKCNKVSAQDLTLKKVKPFFQDKGDLKELVNFFQVATHFHPSHLQPMINDTSFCALVSLLLTRLNHYFNVYFCINRFFGCLK